MNTITLQHITSLHELLALAINDYTKCINDPNIDIDLSVWKTINQGKCTVCIAGSIIHQSLNSTLHEDYPYNYDFKTGDLLEFIEDVQCSSHYRMYAEIANASESIFNRFMTMEKRQMLKSMLKNQIIPANLRRGNLDMWKRLHYILKTVDI